MRLALVTPRFWPLLADDTATHLLRLAGQIREAGHEVTVVTPLWHRSWPRDVLVREISVVRVKGAPRGGWSTLRYLFSLSRWLKEHRGQLDAVLAAGLRHEAYCALGQLAESSVRLALHVDQAGPAGDVAWQRTATFGSRIARRCRQAKSIIAASAAVGAELVEAGYDPRRIATVRPGIPLPPPRSAPGQENARESLVAANPDLTAAAGDPVAVTISRMTPDRGLAHLVKAWRTVVSRFPSARLWIVGDGPERDRLYQLIGDLDLRQRVFLPGTFSDSDEVLAAADLFVQPAIADAEMLPLAEAMAAGLPIVASDRPAHRCWIDDAQGRLVAPGDSRALAAGLLELLDNPSQAMVLGSAARQRIRVLHCPQKCAQWYLELLSATNR